MNEFIIKNGFRSQGNSEVTGSLNVTGGITGSLQGIAATASYYAGSVVSASYATTASYVQLAQTASYVLQAVSASYAPDTTFPYTGSALITGSLNVTGGITGSLQGTATDATGISSAITNNTDNNILTATGTGVINGESNLTFNPSTALLTLTNVILTFAGSEAGIGRIQQSPGGAANGTFSYAQGLAVSAGGDYSHAEGSSTNASGFGSHAEGSGSFTSTSKLYGVKSNTITSGVFQLAGDVAAVFAPGNRLYYNSAAYPDNTTFVVDTSVFGGVNTTITLTNTSITDSDFIVGSLDYPFTSWGGNQPSSAAGGHAEGYYTTAVADWSHAEGSQTQTFARYSHAEGGNTQANGIYSHAEGSGSKTFGQSSHAEGYLTIATGDYSHAEGDSTVAQGLASHAEGASTTATGDYSHAEGSGTAYGNYSHAEGTGTAYGESSHAEGTGTAYGESSHAEGTGTAGVLGFGMEIPITSGVIELLEGYGDQTAQFVAGGFVIIDDNQAEIVPGVATTYIYEISSSTFNGTPATEITLVDTSVNTASPKVRIGIYGVVAPTAADVSIGGNSHAEGEATQTIGTSAHAAGYETRALGWYQSVVGQYNQPVPDVAAFIVGDGVDDSTRHNLLVAASGSVTISGSLILTPTASGAPTSPGTDGQIVFGQASGNYKIYVWLGGAWRSGSLS